MSKTGSVLSGQSVLLLVLSVLACMSIACGALLGEAVGKAIEGGEHGEVCETQEDCTEGHICVQAIEVDPGQSKRLGYRCMQACQRASQCDASKFHTTCCEMTYEEENYSTCFDKEDNLCGKVVEGPSN